MDRVKEVTTKAPVGISTYVRQKHLFKLLNSLLLNDEAHQTEVYIFSDGARTKSDQLKINKLRNAVKKIQGFKKISIIERKQNIGRVKNAEGGLKCLAEKFDFFIYMEDDLIVSKSFLFFMNYCLKTYQNNQDIQSIGGYNAPVQFNKNYDLVAHKILNGWGIGLWSHKPFLNKLLSERDFYGDLIESKSFFQVHEIHKYLHIYLRSINGGGRKGDILGTYLNCRYNWFQIRPSESVVMNNGFDGSGQHCGIDHRFSNINLQPFEITCSDVNYEIRNDINFFKFFNDGRQGIKQIIVKKVLSLLIAFEILFLTLLKLSICKKKNFHK